MRDEEMFCGEVAANMEITIAYCFLVSQINIAYCLAVCLLVGRMPVGALHTLWRVEAGGRDAPDVRDVFDVPLRRDVASVKPP